MFFVFRAFKKDAHNPYLRRVLEHSQKHTIMADKKMIVVGAGLVGSLWATMLAQRGYQVDIYERRSDPRKAGYAGGRSINLALSDRGWKALRAVGFDDEVREKAIPMRGRMMHSADGELTYQPYGKGDQAIYSVDRGALNKTLIQAADDHGGVTFHWDSRGRGVNLENNSLRLEQTDGSIDEIHADRIFGTDGAFSSIRGSLMKTPRFNYSQYYLPHGYKELTIPANPDGSHKMEVNALHIWPRGEFMLIALPNPDGSFTCTLFLAYKGTESFENLNTDQEVMHFFTRFFPDTLPLMPTLLEDWKANPTSDLVTVRCSPWDHQQKTVIFGDASHAIVPFYGQGMNSGFEDCSVLDELYNEQGDWDKAIAKFSEIRPTDANAIADLAFRNFVEMRDWTGDPSFLLRKKIAAKLHDKYPNFLPVYTAVTFSHIRYSEALAEATKQDHMFEEILGIDSVHENWEHNSGIEAIYERYYGG